MLALLLALACRTKPPEEGYDSVFADDPDIDGDGWLNDEDCAPEERDIYPGATERCDGIDNDCDGDVDEDVTTTYYQDSDQDGYGDEATPVEACERPDDAAVVGNDCDDEDPDRFPGSPEVCDDVDNNCDGQIDEGVTGTWWTDADEDGYGDPDGELSACTQPEGSSENDEDCDDTNAKANPGETEVCDEADNDCDGTVDEGVTTTYFGDVDEDGYGDADFTIEACALPTGYSADDLDCDDGDPGVYPGAVEVTADGIDQDCDGGDTCYTDDDGDGYGDDSGATVGSADLDCEDAGETDEASDCDDGASTTYPGADEYCDEVDNDCDGDVDEDDALDAYTWSADSDGDGYGDAGVTSTSCDAPTGYVSDDTDCDDSDADVNPGESEVTADGIDNDCDGNEQCFVDDDGDEHGDEDGSTVASSDLDCEDAGESDVDDDCDDADADVNPDASETCNAVDDDCDGDIDEGVLGTGADCPAEDCAEILADNASAADGTYTLDLGDYECDMGTDGGGWTLVQEDAAVYGTGYDTSYYNSEGFTWDEVFFEWASGSTHGHCTYPSAMTSCVPLGFQFDSESWGVAQNWGSSICGMSTTDYTSNTTFVGSDFIIDRSASSDTIRLGMLEGISSCTTSDNYGTAYVDIWVRQ
jgi:hypothetical protein